MQDKFKRFLSISSGLLFCLAGCATTKDLGVSLSSVLRKAGVYHKVRKGETIWRIARTYQVDIEDIVLSNNMPNAARIEVDQLVFIPNADKVKEINLEQSSFQENEFAWPVKGKILFYFGDKDEYSFSNGIAIESHEGNMVYAARSGVVVFTDYLPGYTQTVIIDHLDGYSTVYSNNASLLVELGDSVSKGDVISQVARNGRLAFLHFEVRKNGIADNPIYYLP